MSGAERTEAVTETPRIAFLHTVPGLVQTFETTTGSRATTQHVVDADLFRTASGEVGLGLDGSVAAVARHVRHAASAGADAVVVTCSTLGPAATIVAGFASVPVIRIDAPMADRAVGLGHRIGVVVTLESNRASSRAVVQEAASAVGRQVEITDALCEGAFDLLAAGDREAHDDRIRQLVKELAAEVDVVVLAQASMASASDGFDAGVPVLTSPATAVDAALDAAGAPRTERPPVTGAVDQLRIYRIRDGLMPQWLRFFDEVLVPLHELVGIPVAGHWLNPADPAEFVWIRRFRSVETVAEQEAAFFGSVPRAALGDVRGRYVADLQVRLLEPRGRRE